MQRREFFREIMQYSILSVLVGSGAYLMLREKSAEECDLDFICRDCKKSRSCDLPSAEQYRKKEKI